MDIQTAVRSIDLLARRIPRSVRRCVSPEFHRADLKEFPLAEGGDVVAEGVGEGVPETVVRDVVELQGAAGFGADAAADENKRDVIKCG